MASFKNKIDLKKTRRFLTLNGSTVQIKERDLFYKSPDAFPSPKVWNGNATPLFIALRKGRSSALSEKEKEVSFNNEFNFHPPVVEDGAHTRESVYLTSISDKNIDSTREKQLLFSRNEIRTSKQISLFSKGSSPDVGSSDFALPHVTSGEWQGIARYEEVSADSYLKIFFHCNLETNLQTFKETYIKAVKPSSIKSYLRKKYLPFLFKSVTKRGSSIDTIDIISKSPSKSSRSQKIFPIAYTTPNAYDTTSGDVTSLGQSFALPFMLPDPHRKCEKAQPSMSNMSRDAHNALRNSQERVSSADRYEFGTPKSLSGAFPDMRKNVTGAKNIDLAKQIEQTVERPLLYRAKKGNHFVIVLKKHSFWLVERLVKDESISILGGIYGKTPIGQKAILSLAKAIKEDNLYYRSIYLLQKKPASFLSALSGVYSRLWLTLCFLKNEEHQRQSACESEG